MFARTAASSAPLLAICAAMTLCNAPVSITPGITLLTVTPRPATSFDNDAIAPCRATRTLFDNDIFG